TVWTTNESGGSETVINADTNQVTGTIDLGGEAGNVYYDPVAGQMLVDVQSRNQLAVIDPTALTITRRVPLPGCDHDHGLSLDPTTHRSYYPSRTARTESPRCSHSTPRSDHHEGQS